MQYFSRSNKWQGMNSRSSYCWLSFSKTHIFKLVWPYSKANLSCTRKSRTRVMQKFWSVFVYIFALKAELQEFNFEFCQIKLGQNNG